MAYLSIKNFYKKFGQTEVLKGIDVDIEKGEVLTIIGSSGSGKTTLLRCINFLEMPDDGIMTLGDTELFNPAVKDTEKTLRDKRLNFGLVFQSFNLFPQYNVLDNVKLAPSLLLNEKAKGYKKQLKGQKEFTRREIAHKVHQFKEDEKAKIEKDALDLLEKTGLTEKAKAGKLDKVIGREKELERLNAEKKKLEGEIKRVEGKLSNESFVAKAPQKVVDEERAKGEKYKAMLEKVLESLENLK